jgi:hypothetical protein
MRPKPPALRGQAVKRARPRVFKKALAIPPLPPADFRNKIGQKATLCVTRPKPALERFVRIEILALHHRLETVHNDED